MQKCRLGNAVQKCFHLGSFTKCDQMLGYSQLDNMTIVLYAYKKYLFSLFGTEVKSMNQSLPINATIDLINAFPLCQ